MTAVTKRDAVLAAVGLAEDIDAGKIAPDELGRAAAEECRELFGVAVGPDDPLWPLHVDIARQVLALNGVPAGELAEWASVARLRAERVAAALEPPPPSADPGGSGSPVSEPRGPVIGPNYLAARDNTDPNRHSDESGDES